MDDKIKSIVEQFSKNWIKKPYVVGILVCGSYVTGNPSKHSDIDIHIIFDGDTDFRQRGNEFIDGIMIEYFANPKKQIEKYMEDNYNSNSIIDFHMFVTGEIIYEKNNDIKDLKKIAKSYLNKKFKKLSKTQIEIMKYMLWDNYDNFIEASKRENENIDFLYYNLVYDIFNSYSKFLRYYFIKSERILRTLTDKKFRQKYLLKEFPDKQFSKMIIKILDNKSKISSKSKLENIKKLNNYVIEKMGGLELNGLKIKSKVDF